MAKSYFEAYTACLTEIQKQSSHSPITLIAVSKTKPYETIRQAYLEGIRHFGENYVPEAIEKFSQLFTEFPAARDEVVLHHLGPLQSGTVRKLVGFFSYTHGVSSLSALQELQKRAEKEKKKIGFFLQWNFTGEERKQGWSLEGFRSKENEVRNLESEFLSWEGFMIMGPSSGDPIETKQVFAQAKRIRDKEYPKKTLSMGMSGDFLLAAKYGSNWVRIGSAIFGERL